MVAAAYSDSPVVGIPALRLCMGSLQSTALDVAAWCIAFRQRDGSETPDFAFAPGFGLVTEQQAKLLLAACGRLLGRRSRRKATSRMAFYLSHHDRITRSCGPLNSVGLMALFCLERGLTMDDAERHFMTLRIDCAIVEAQRSRNAGLSRFPFLSENYRYEGPWPARPTQSNRNLLQEIGLE
jgi:hypothetical protein